MACTNFHFSRTLKTSLKSPTNFYTSHIIKLTFPSRSLSHSPIKSNPRTITATSNTSSSFSWDDVVRISQPDYTPSNDNDSSTDLNGFFQRIKLCNRGSELRAEFIPFLVEEQIVGYVHNRFATYLRRFPDVFTFPQGDPSRRCSGGSMILHSMLKTPEDRTTAVGDVIKSLGELIPGIRNELYPVTSSFGTPPFFSLERAAAPYFGIKAYGVHMNGYVEKDGQKFLWIAKRSHEKPTYPGMLDHLVAGGLPHGISCGENLVKECEEEAGIPRHISENAIPVGAVSYIDIDGYRYKRDVLFCYDLNLPEGYIPINEDGEVESFQLIPVPHVANVIRRTQFFKPNCSIVIIDFLFRHGYIRPEDFGYLDLLQDLKSGDCS